MENFFKKTLLLFSVLLCSIFVALHAQAQQRPQAATLFTDVRIFDGKSAKLSEPSHVLIEGNTISKISRSTISDELPPETFVIAGAGRTLMPGLIDAHWHSVLASVPMLKAMTADASYVHIAAAAQAKETLMRGFTTVRDAGGPSFGLKTAIDEGITPGPRIYPSGAMISQTGGHGDFRLRHEVPRANVSQHTYLETIGVSVIADGPDEVRRRVREQLMLGASQIKLMAGGGVTSLYDPLDVTQYSLEELRVAVEAARNWGTYVTVHAYTAAAIRMAIEAGVRCIEHGQLIDDATAKIMAQKEVWWSLQPFLDDEHSNPKVGEARRKQLLVSEGTDKAFELAKRHRIRIAWGTDVLFSVERARQQGAMLAKMTRWFSPAQVLALATSSNAELLQLSGPRNPYPGKLGVVAEGALADLILVDGDPIVDIGIIAEPEEKFLVIMKEGVIFKNSVSHAPTVLPQLEAAVVDS